MDILREVGRDPIARFAKRHGVSEQTISLSRQRFSGMNVNDVRGLRLQEQGNAWLMKMLAEQDLETEVMKEVPTKMVCTPPSAG
jgi:putative transposase